VFTHDAAEDMVDLISSAATQEHVDGRRPRPPSRRWKYSKKTARTNVQARRRPQNWVNSDRSWPGVA